jgi:hypothetical protein
MGLLRNVAAVVLILAALFAGGRGEGAASDGVLHGNSGTTTSSGVATLLFSSGFESATTLDTPISYGNGARQYLSGTDSTTGFNWTNKVWGGDFSFNLIVNRPINGTPLSFYMHNEIQNVTGHDGKPTQALYMEITNQGGSFIQDELTLEPPSEQGDMYVSFWLKLQPDLLTSVMTPQNWFMVFEWKTGGPTTEDYRMKAEIDSWGDGCGGVKPNGPMFWRVTADNNYTNGYQEYWHVDNCGYAIPVDQWFKFEVFWHRSHSSDGRFWMAVDGHIICDRYEANYGVSNDPIDRIFLPNLYTNGPYPVYWWVDNLQIWDGFPPVGNNPPYAPH